MKRLATISILVILAILVTTNAHALPQLSATNLLENPGFEDTDPAWHYGVHWWGPDGTRYYTAFGNMFVPNDWEGWFLHQAECRGGYVTAQPEMQVITQTPDPVRVRSGEQAAKLFTFWQCHKAGYWQTVTVEPGLYQGRVYPQVWHSNCSQRPHDPPLDYDCQTPYNSSQWIRVGIDPTGGTDPRSDDIVWSEPIEQYGMYGPAVITPLVMVTGTEVTFFIESKTEWPAKHDDAYIDDSALYRIWAYVLPIIFK
jgi:hypothetical protein